MSFSYGSRRSHACRLPLNLTWLPLDTLTEPSGEPTLKAVGCTKVVLSKSPRGKLVFQHVDENNKVVSKNIVRGAKELEGVVNVTH